MNEDQDPRKHAAAVFEAVKSKMFEMDDVVRLCIVALYTDGHVLLEGNPGFGKTSLVKTLADVLHFDFGRIQFTPDLMPTDITGAMMPNFNDPTQKWEFREGPIFRELILADEINRATPKTQSAMLEAMAERQVTTLDKEERERWLPEPFMVLATQNPIDQEGTYNLPEAQADRFMLKILMPVPKKQGIAAILKKETDQKSARKKNKPTDDEVKRAAMAKKEASEQYRAVNAVIRATKIIGKVETHIHNLYLASNGYLSISEPDPQIREISGSGIGKLSALCEMLQYGLGPRAPSALLLGVKGWVVLFGQGSALDEGVEKDALEGFAKIVLPVLRHRIRLNYEWKEKYTKLWDEQTWGKPPPETEDVLLREYLLADLVLAAAPQTPDARRSSQPYYDSVRADLQKQMRLLRKS